MPDENSATAGCGKVREHAPKQVGRRQWQQHGLPAHRNRPFRRVGHDEELRMKSCVYWHWVWKTTMLSFRFALGLAIARSRSLRESTYETVDF